MENPRYLPNADINGNGWIGDWDLRLAQQNLGASTHVRPLSLSAAVDRTFDPTGRETVSQPDITIVGHTEPGATLALDQGNVGTTSQVTSADANGLFHFAIQVGTGVTPFHVAASDTFGQRATFDLFVTRKNDIIDSQPPIISIETPGPNLLTNSNVTITGQVTDDLSGVAKLQAQVDSGPLVDVSFDSSGNFHYATNLLLGGSADGVHTVQLTATDQARNVSSPMDYSFTLDTVPPVVTVSSPTSGLVTAQNVAIKGQVSDERTGVAVLRASVDGGAYTDVALDASGSFHFTTNLALDSSADGSNTVQFAATDKAGNISQPFAFTFTLDTQGPTISIQSPAQGLVTHSNVTIAGEVTGTVADVASLSEQVNSGPVVPLEFDSSGDFQFTTGLALDGSADGIHTVRLVATDVRGNVSGPTDIRFTLDTIPPVQPAFSLATVDQENGLALSTTDGQATLTGQTDANVSLNIAQTGATASSTNTGAFQFPGVGLALGDNALTVVATDAAGNTSQYQVTIHRDAATGGVNPVIYWNQVQLQAIENDASTPEYASRGLAMVSAAVYDAVNAIDGTPGYYVSLKAPAGASADAAVSAAAYTVLAYLYPAQVSSFNSLLATAMATVPDGQSKTDGMSVGQSVANAIIAMRANDGSTNYVDYTPGTAPGDWQPTAPAYAPAENPQWATLVPFAMTSDSQFRPGRRPPWTARSGPTTSTRL